MELQAIVSDAFAQLDITTQVPDADTSGVDLLVEADGVRVALALHQRALVTDSDADQALKAHITPGVTLLMVADRVTGSARKLLTARHAGYYDLRGRLALHAAGMVIDAVVEPLRGRAPRTSALSGQAGLEVAAALLMRPERREAVRELARRLGRSASTVSSILAALRRDGLVDAKNTVPDSRLFWLLADRWTTPRTYLAHLPSHGDASSAQALRLGLDDVGHGSGWALTDSAAAAAYGAPVAFRSGMALDFYVPDRAVLRRATTLLGVAAGPAEARATVRIAPVPAIVRQRLGPGPSPIEWPLAHPLFVALDLAQDAGRGREILDAWTPPAGGARVW